jgi:hypothetical protein
MILSPLQINEKQIAKSLFFLTDINSVECVLRQNTYKTAFVLHQKVYREPTL